MIAVAENHVASTPTTPVQMIASIRQRKTACGAVVMSKPFQLHPVNLAPLSPTFPKWPAA
ncbi:hypothetical protein G5V65_11125 [Rhodobacter sp. HX-7-19]|uniref:Uncharacterized protein n=1 Tax=Paragemmobacter kunshanensis TaxID=2583234 RepID=A0A6M1TTN6_9RHOB|nr:hypothetical protein [Rhodobacter kunshanensis]